MQQISAEAAFGGQRIEVLVGRGDHPHVHADQLAAADAEEFVLGQHPQQPRLQRQRHVADFVEKKRSAVGLLEAADVTARGAGERTGLVAEQFAFQQFRRNRRGVQRDERLARARRFAVQRARHQLLAGAGFAGHQHAQRRLRQAADGAEQRLHRRRVADQRIADGRIDRGRLFDRQRIRAARAAGRQRLRGERDRSIEIEGFRQEFMRAAAERTGGAGDVGVGAHHDHRQLRVLRLDRIQQHQPVVAGHAHIGEQQLRGRAADDRIQHAARGVEGGDLVTRFAQRGGQYEAHRAVVVDHPDRRGVMSCSVMRHRYVPSWIPHPHADAAARTAALR